MKKMIILIVLLLAGYMIYNYLFSTGNSAPSNTELTSQDYAARQLEAQDMLMLVYQREESYHNRYGSYTYKFDSLDVVPHGTYYKLRVLDVRIGHFEVKAEGNIDKDPTIDVWLITEDGKPQNLVNDTEK